MSEEDKEIEQQAALHHASQSLSYYMGLRYHTKRGNKVYSVICRVGIAFHLWSAFKHLRKCLRRVL
jgi:hypothetical protein